MYVSKTLFAAAAVVVLVAGLAGAAVVQQRSESVTPPSYAAHLTTSPAALNALSEMLRLGERAGRPRLQPGLDDIVEIRDGNLLGNMSAALRQQLGEPGAVLGLMVADPVESAVDAARLLRARGFTATLIEGADPGSPTTFLMTDAFAGTVIVFQNAPLRTARQSARRTTPQPGS